MNEQSCTTVTAPPSELLDPARSRRVLFITYVFPPVGGAGVQRTTKFVKYLPRHGWQTSVLTVANPSVPAFDRSLEGDVPPETIVRKARTLEPSYATKSAVVSGGGSAGGKLKRLARSLFGGVAKTLLQPDPQVLWLPAALREGKRLLREVPHDAIVVSGPPFSSFLVGAALSRWSGLPLVLDYRDEWGLSSAYWENKRIGPLSRFVQGRMQNWAVRQARVLLATTRSSMKTLEAVRSEARSKAEVGWVYNGYDPDDFPPTPAPPREDGSRYRMAYVGTLWELTSVAPVVEAVRRLAKREPSLAAELELIFAGRRVAAQQAIIGRLAGLPCRVTEHPYLDHDRAVELVRSSDAVCALLSDLSGAGRVVPAKIFEYLAARRSILAVAPRGELWDILDGYPRAVCHTPGDVEGIANWLAEEIRSRKDARADVNDRDCSRYSRDSQACELASLLNTLKTAAR